MSYDVSLYFRGEEFPLEQWQQVIAEFKPQRRNFKPVSLSDATVAQWTITRNDETAWLMLREVGADGWFKPVPANWELCIARVGHHPRSIWLQFAIAYYTLVLIHDVIFYDGQFDRVITDEAEYLKFAGDVLSRKGLSTMFGLGLMDGEGIPIF